MKFMHRFVLAEAAGAYRIYKADGVSMRLDFFEGMLRVALIRDGSRLLPTWSVCPGGGDCPLEGRDKLSAEGLAPLEPEVSEDEDLVRFELDGLRFTVEKLNFRITAENEKGILYQDRSGLAYNFAGELGDGSVHYTRREEDQRIFGLGDKCGGVDKSGMSFALGAGDAMGFRAGNSDPLYKQVPFYICENGAGSYGLFYDTYSNGRADFGREHDNYFEPFNSVRFEEENMVFYLITGSAADIVRRFTRLCGGCCEVPEWAFRYCGSTMEYTDAEDADARLRGFVRRCGEEGINAGAFYLSSGYTQLDGRRCVFCWNTDRIPSPGGLADYFREHGMELIPNVKPAFLTEHPMYGKIAENGWFLHYADGSPALFPFWGGFASYLDFTNPGAYDFWRDCVKTSLAANGYYNIWNDNNEYDVWDADVLACGFGGPVRARLIRPLFSYLMSRASREACLEAAPGKAPLFNVSRCAIAGTQRGATTWSGDDFTDFRELRFTHYQAMTMALSGFSFFGQDIGGFYGPKPSPELFMRWLQYGVFMPRFVLHSWKPGEESTMPWLYPELMPAVKRIFGLRERLVPYLAEQYRLCAERFEPLICPVFLRFPGYDTEADCFFCGSNILACPVFDEGASSVKVLLPGSGTLWRLRGSGPVLKGGAEVEIPCAPEDEPVWFSTV